MTRTILAALAAAIAVTIVSGTGCSATGVGDPCTPEQEYLTDFLEFNVNEVSTESKSFQCQTRLCLVNHFQGRVTCPYGQDMAGAPPNPVTNCCAGQNQQACPSSNAGCCTPGVAQPVTGPLPAASTGEAIDPQCVERTPDKAVYCSCRCADVNGNTNDGANYCTCPDGFACTQLVTSIGAGNTGLTGAYCVKNGTQYASQNPCTKCNPTLANCGAAPGVSGG
ncbi:MAG TPA: hypothetical protein VGM06_04845 [Polyangiaceae bacterium]|jgi:hypothetical protein